MDQSAPSRAVRRCGEAVPRLARRSFTLDARSLAAFRIGVGLILVADCLLRTRDFRLMFAADGIFPPDTIRAFHGTAAKWSLALLDDAAWCGGGVLAAEGLGGLLLMVGWHTRAATVIAWAAVLSVIRRTSPATNAGDMWLACQLFWAMFLPLGAVWSVDARRRSDRHAPEAPAAACSIATGALVLQLAVVYLGAGLSKCNPAWLSGTAMSYALSIHDHGTSLGMMLARIDWLTRGLTWLIPVVEITTPVLLVCCPGVRVRTFLVAAFTLFHAAIWLTMSVGLFAAIGMAAWLPLVPGAVWDRSRLERTSTNGAVAGLGGTASAACGVALILAVTSFLHGRGLLGSRPLPQAVAAGIVAGGLEQEWSMFGDIPAQEQWVYGRARLADGRVVDLLRGGRPLETERPAGGFGSLPHHRWHKFFWILPRPGVRMFGAPAAAALAREWNAGHDAAAQVRSLELRFATQSVTAPDATLRDMLVAAWPPRDADGEGNLDRLLQSAADGPEATR
jgi:hypothetical protein